MKEPLIIIGVLLLFGLWMWASNKNSHRRVVRTYASVYTEEELQQLVLTGSPWAKDALKLKRGNAS